MTDQVLNLDSLDDVIHGRLRLGVMAYLSTAESADFNTLKARTQSSDGNLSVQLRKLEDAAYIRIEKSFIGKKPLTTISLTDEGRAAYIRYLEALRALVGGAL